MPPKLDDGAVIFEGSEFGFYDEKSEFELKEPLQDGKLTCAAFKDLVERFEFSGHPASACLFDDEGGWAVQTRARKWVFRTSWSSQGRRTAGAKRS